MQRFLINLLYLWNFDNEPHEKYKHSKHHIASSTHNSYKYKYFKNIITYSMLFNYLFVLRMRLY